jgi:phenylpropionate dioxygenase-like ring-hydroxylating dioxygenase large terminal subunit
VPENFKVKSWPTAEKHGIIYIWHGDARDSYPEPPFFDNIDDKFSRSTHACPWTQHYTRCIENQLDVTHLSFVHYDTIGRGNHTISDGPVVETTDTEIKFWVFNRKEDGKPSVLPKDMKKPDSPPMLHFKFPNIWENNIADGMKESRSTTGKDLTLNDMAHNGIKRINNSLTTFFKLASMGNDQGKQAKQRERHDLLERISRNATIRANRIGNFDSRIE